jgi:hypothetical protein
MQQAFYDATIESTVVIGAKWVNVGFAAYPVPMRSRLRELP